MPDLGDAQRRAAASPAGVVTPEGLSRRARRRRRQRLTIAGADAVLLLVAGCTLGGGIRRGC